jgi:hypothetical protein
MTMHLVGPALTMNRTKKKVFKLTKQQREIWNLDWMARNRELKRQGKPKISFEQFCDARRGIVPEKKRVHPSKMGEYNGPSYTAPPGRMMSIDAKSLDSGASVAVKQEVQQYTGTNMLGIGQLHKSNSVPVFRKEDAEDQAKMRRG